MCIVSMIGDYTDKYPAWPVVLPAAPYVPSPIFPAASDPVLDFTAQIAQVRELLAIMREVTRLQEKAGCLCDPAHVRNKPDYIGRLVKRIAELEQALAEEMLKNEQDAPTTFEEF